MRGRTNKKYNVTSIGGLKTRTTETVNYSNIRKFIKSAYVTE